MRTPAVFAALAPLWTLLGCGGAGPLAVEPDQDRDGPHLDREDPFTGRIVAPGQDFVMTRGESVALGPHAPVVQWQAGGGAEPVVVTVILQRVPPDMIPGLVLRPGIAVNADHCAILLVNAHAAEPPRVTLRVTCRR